MSLSRRSFFVSSGLAVAGSVASGHPANDVIDIAVIGCGGRARHLLKSLNDLPGANVIVLCDVWDKALDETRAMCPTADAVRKADTAFGRKDIQAVLVATPDHWHVPLTVAACEAGKDVYVEKPLTHDLGEGPAVVEAQNRHKRVVQVGTQQRSMPHIVRARDLIRGGAIGTVRKMRMSWNRNSDRVRRNPLGVNPQTVDWATFRGAAPDQPFDEYRFRNWRWFWDFGGGIFTDLMVHWVDVAHWVLDLDHPSKAVSLGEFVTAKGVWETPDTVQTLLAYPTGVQMHFEGTFSNARKGAHIEFLGDNGSVYVDRGRFELVPEKGRKVEAVQEIVGTGPPGADFYDKPDGERLHLANWLDCVRTRKRPNSPAESGVSSAAAAHLANLALRSGQTAVWKG
jgi:predicted dehydrogenase